MVVKNFNTDLVAPEGRERDERIVSAMEEEGLEDMRVHFLPLHTLWLKDGHTGAMHRGGREVRSRTNYILSIDSRLFQNVAIQDARHNTDHFLVLGCLRGTTPAVHLHYRWRCTRFPIRPPENPDRVDCMFAKLWRAITRPPQWERHCQAWISPET